MYEQSTVLSHEEKDYGEQKNSGFMEITLWRRK